jgi:hypothetical protein
MNVIDPNFAKIREFPTGYGGSMYCHLLAFLYITAVS